MTDEHDEDPTEEDIAAYDAMAEHDAARTLDALQRNPAAVEEYLMFMAKSARWAEWGLLVSDTRPEPMPEDALAQTPGAPFYVTVVSFETITAISKSCGFPTPKPLERPEVYVITMIKAATLVGLQVVKMETGQMLLSKGGSA